MATTLTELRSAFIAARDALKTVEGEVGAARASAHVTAIALFRARQRQIDGQALPGEVQAATQAQTAALQTLAELLGLRDPPPPAPAP